MKVPIFYTIVSVQIVGNIVATCLFYYLLNLTEKQYSLVSTCAYGASVLPLVFGKKYKVIIIALVARMIPFIIDIAIIINFLSWKVIYIQMIANIVCDIPIYILGIFIVGRLAGEIYDPYSRFANPGIFST